MKPIALASFVLLISLQQSPPLERLLETAATYVADYQRQLQGVVFEERYRQFAEREMGPLPEIRDLRSDLLLVADREHGWVEFRDVFEVDGHAVRDRAERLQKLFLTPGIDPFAQARRLVEEGSRFNLNHPELTVERSINMPLMVLRYLTADNQHRFRFRSDGTGNVGGQRASRVWFDEQAMPRIIQTGNDAPVSGRVWLDPATGAVLRTELFLTIHDRTAPLGVRIKVEFARDAKLGLLLPRQMNEEYQRAGIRITGRAEYSNPRRFAVETSTEIRK